MESSHDMVVSKKALFSPLYHGHCVSVQEDRISDATLNIQNPAPDVFYEIVQVCAELTNVVIFFGFGEQNSRLQETTKRFKTYGNVSFRKLCGFPIMTTN